MSGIQRGMLIVTATLLLALAGNTLGIQTSDESKSASFTEVPLGHETKIEGVIVNRSEDEFRLRAHNGTEYKVSLAGNAEIEEKKKNPFRGAIQYSREDLRLGLNVEVEGVGGEAGDLIAQEVKFTQDALQIAETITSSLEPVENRLNLTEEQLGETRAQLDETRETMDRTQAETQGRLEELDEAYRLARGEAESANQQAVKAIEGVGHTQQRINSLDDYEEAQAVAIQFGFDSAVLTDEARGQLDDLISAASQTEAFLIEVTGFASPEGDPDYNRRLSQQRADAVVRYLAENGDISLRRFISPYGFGESRPVAGNESLEGRQQNRRAEVRLLINRGISQSSTGSMSSVAPLPEQR